MRSKRVLRRVPLGIAVVLVLLAIGAVSAYAAVSLPTAGPPNEVKADADREVNRDVPNSQSAAHVPSAQVPRPSSVGVSTGVAGVVGLNHFDQRYGADNGNQFSLEPPDQGLCTNGSSVLEPVNDVASIYENGVDTTGPVSLTRFYTGESQIVRHEDGSATYGEFLSDPKCYWDPATDHWFMTILEIGQDPSTGDFTDDSAELIAVTREPGTLSLDPGDWYFYSIDTSNDGGSAADSPSSSRTLPAHPGCPCFGDQPLIGADANGFYITSNEFPIEGDGFNGAQVYAFSKIGLESGNLKMQYVAGGDQALGLAEGPAYSLQPATSPTPDDWSGESGGTEYLLSALDFDATLDNRIAVWALTNTSSLDTTPDVHLSSVVLDSEVYGQPPDATQKDGPTPLAQVVEQLYGAKKGKGNAAKEELLAGNDDRMNQAVYANGQLWGALNTVVKTQNGPTRVGSAWFEVSPSVSGNQVGASIAHQGYVSVNNENLLFPSIGVTHGGKAVYVATLVGPDYYPSAVYTTIDPVNGPGTIEVSGAGVGPDDGYTGYPPFGGPTGRWGDYSAAVADPGGSVWLATEYVGQSCSLETFVGDTTCGGTRTLLANWGTYITKVTP